MKKEAELDVTPILHALNKCPTAMNIGINASATEHI